MKIDKFKIYILEISLLCFLFFTLFAPSIISRLLLAIILVLFAIIVFLSLKKRNAISLYEKQVTSLLLTFGVIHLGIFYLLGLYFGFQNSKFQFSFWTLYKYIIPTIAIIISSEYIRHTFLSQKIYIKIKKIKLNLSSIFTFLSMVILDMILYTGVQGFNNLNEFLTMIGFVMFASISCNLLYNYLSVRYGSKGIIIYRIITIIYMFIIPITPDVYIFLRSFLRMLYPFLMYLIIDGSYSKKISVTPRNQRIKSTIINSIILILIVLGIMLISCKFRFGILVIGSYSMTGTINKGDAVIYEQYKNQNIEEGQIVVFNYNGIPTIHRIVEINRVNGEYRYYTKGDANPYTDDGYSTITDIEGIVLFKVKYIGYPTLLLRQLFNE